MTRSPQETDANGPATGSFLVMSEHRFIILLCLLAGLHVFLFSASFPFFNIVDEQTHFDLVVRYSTGHLPRAMEVTSPEALPYIVHYSSPEYLYPPNAFEDGKIPPPPWKQPHLSSVTNLVFLMEEGWKQVINVESATPPLYYTGGRLVAVSEDV